MVGSLAALTDSVYQQMEGGNVNDDSRLSYDLVRDKVLRITWEMLGKYYSRYLGSLPDVLYQRCCIELSCTPICDSPVTRLIGTLPGMMGMMGGRELRYVGTVDGRAFNRSSTRVLYEHYQPFSGKPTPSYRVTGNEIELIDAPLGMTVAEVEGIFADPTQCKLCVDDEQFIVPCPPEMLNSIEKQCIQELTQWWKQFRIDKRNDAIPNV